MNLGNGFSDANASPAIAVGGAMIIGIAGRKRAGKDTLANGLAAALSLPIDSFAAPLRRFVGDILGMRADALELMKEQPVTWLDGITPRSMMQTVGTEWGRNMVHSDLWVRSLFERCPNGVIVPDVRFPNEAEAIRQRGGVILRVTRQTWQAHDAHASETPLPDRLVDIEIRNNATPAELVENGLRMLRFRGVIA